MVRGSRPARVAGPRRLYLDGGNDRAGRAETSPRFTDVTAASGLAEVATGYGIGVAVGDYDNDGRPDLYLTGNGANQLLRNDGVDAAGVPRFRDVTAAAGVGEERLSVPAVFADFDGDGWLDLFVGNYVQVPEPAPTCRNNTGMLDYCGPDSFRPEPDRLFRNRGRDAAGVYAMTSRCSHQNCNMLGNDGIFPGEVICGCHNSHFM